MQYTGIYLYLVVANAII